MRGLWEQTKMPKVSLIASIKRDYFNLPLFMWLALWAAINTGPWNLSGFGAGGLATLNAIRGIAPIAVMFVSFVLLSSQKRHPRGGMTAPEGLFWVYGVAMVVASLPVESWFNTAYWGFSFMAVLMVARFYVASGKPLLQIVRLNYLTWVVASIVLVLLLFFARDVLFEAETGYGLVRKASEVAGGAMSGAFRRDSGSAGLRYVLAGQWLGELDNCGRCVRGFRISGLVHAVAWSLVFPGGNPGVRHVVHGEGAPGDRDRVVCAGSWMVPEQTQTYVVEHATRGTGVEGLKTMSGRDRIFRNAWQAIQEQPILGYGPQADRRIIGENAQNGLLYAWLSGGLLGMLGYVGGMLAAWWYFLKIIFGKFRMGSQARDMLIMTGGILAFFSLRSYPENTAALFSVDLLVQLPAMVYIAMLYRYQTEVSQFFGAMNIRAD